MDAALSILAILGLFVFGGLATYTLKERKHRANWRRTAQAPVEPNHAPFRRPGGPSMTKTVLVQDRAPAAIRRTALWSIYMGQMTVPGGLLGMFGLLFAGIGIVAVPGLVLAIRIWELGFALLRCDVRAIREARLVARFAIWLNVVVVAIAVAMPVLGGEEFLGLTALMVVYAAISFAHAAALQRCADLLADDQLLRDGAATQIPTYDAHLGFA